MSSTVFMIVGRRSRGIVVIVVMVLMVASLESSRVCLYLSVSDPRLPATCWSPKKSKRHQKCRSVGLEAELLMFAFARPQQTTTGMNEERHPPESLSVPFPSFVLSVEPCPPPPDPPRYPPSAPPVSPLSLSLVLVVVVVSLSSTLGLRAAGVASLRPFGVVRCLTTTHGTGRGKDIMELALREGH